MAHIEDGHASHGPADQRKAPDSVGGGWRIAWIAAVVFIVGLTFGSCGQMLKFMYLDPGSAGDIGAAFVRDNGGPSGTVVVHNLRPGSALAAAGIRESDRVRLDYPWDDLRMTEAGETFGLTRLSGAAPRHIGIVLPAAPPMAEADKLSNAITPLGNMTIVLIGLFVMLRSRGDRAAMLLGTGFALVGPIPPYVWPIPATHVPFWQVPVWAGIDLLPWFLLGFAITYVEKTTGRLPAWQKATFWSLTGLQILCCLYEITDTLLNLGLPAIAIIRPLNYILQIFGLVLPVYFFAVGWFRSPPQMRARFTVMFIALPVTFLAQSAYVFATLFATGLIDLKSPFLVAAGMGIFFGPLLFTYAVFRHKVLDIGFAINRTLVYGVLSVILLLVFGLIEWASEKFIPIESREKNLFIDAGIALGIFLLFHRVRDFVEGFIEKLFFRRWHDNEARLRAFVRRASFITSFDALTAAFTAELERFSGGAPVALLLAEGESFGHGKKRTGGNDPAVVAMKADRAPVEAAGQLYLPMIHRAELTGFVRLGAKPSEEAYRPDERDVLAWAVVQIGLDLHAIRVERLELANKELVIRLDQALAMGARR